MGPLQLAKIFPTSELFFSALFAISTVLPLTKILSGLSINDPGRHEIEAAL